MQIPAPIRQRIGHPDSASQFRHKLTDLFFRPARKAFTYFVLLTFLVSGNVAPLGYVSAQEVLTLPAPTARLELSPGFTPPLLTGIKVYPNDPFRLDFILDKGDFEKQPAGGDSDNSGLGTSSHDLTLASNRLIRYFLAALTVPEKDIWVNLSPYEQDRILTDDLGQTELGRDLLAQDYLLKQITASVMYPENEVGKKFWAKVYEEAAQKFGTTDIPVDTFNKVWIVPQKAVVYENASAGTAYVVESTLKVMLDSDYLAQQKATAAPTAGGEGSATSDQNIPTRDRAPLINNNLSKEILREIVIPILEKEVNEGKNFAPLRQVYQSLILASWYKRKIKASLLSSIYVDQKKVRGVNIDDPRIIEKVWAQYVEGFKKGAYNIIKEERDVLSGELIPRKYFSGGVVLVLEHAMSFTNEMPKPRSASVVEARLDLAMSPTPNESTWAGMEEYDIKGIRTHFSWKNPKGEEFNEETGLTHQDIKQHLRSLVGDRWRLQTILQNIYKVNVDVNNIEHLSIIFTKTGDEKHVFKVAIKIRGQPEEVNVALAMKTFHYVTPSEAATDYTVRVHANYAWTGLLPTLGGKVGRFIYVEWIKGDTTEKVLGERPLTKEEIIGITTTWMRFGKEAGYPIDIHPGNIMFRSAENDYREGFAVVDGYAYDKNASPTLMLRDLIKYYSSGTEEGLAAVLNGIEIALGPKAQNFLLEALINEPAHWINDVTLAKVQTFLESRRNPQGPTIENLLFAKVIKKAIALGLTSIGIQEMLAMSSNETLSNIRTRYRLNTILNWLVSNETAISQRTGHSMKDLTEAELATEIGNVLPFILAHGRAPKDEIELQSKNVTEATGAAASIIKGETTPNKNEPKTQDNAEAPGGIDLTTQRMDLKTNGNGEEMRFYIDPALLEQFWNASGFRPVIINIRPLEDIQRFLGSKPEKSITPVS